MKLYRVILVLAGIMMLAGCEKSPYNVLEGRWKPVFASGTYDDGTIGIGYVYYYDGPADSHGTVSCVRVARTNPELRYEETTTIPGYRFFRKDGKDVFENFFMDTPGEAFYKPLMYKVEGGKIYREWPWAYLINGDSNHLDHLMEGSGHFDNGTPITFLDDGRITIGNFTYQRMD